MKNNFYLISIFCSISNIIHPMQMQPRKINISQKSKEALLVYALTQSAKDNYWPLEASVTLESFTQRGEEYEARFAGRWLTPIPSLENATMMQMCLKRSAFITKETLDMIGVTLP